MAAGDFSCLGGTGDPIPVAPGPNQNATSVSWLHWPEAPQGVSLIRQPSGHPIQYDIRTTRLMLAIGLLILEKWECREPSQSIRDQITGFITSQLGKGILSSAIEHQMESRDQ